MKKLVCFSLLLLLFFSCKTETKKQFETIKVKPVAVTIERFDKIFYESKPENLALLKNEYPYLFPSQVEDTVWINKINDKLLRELYQEVQNKYPNNSELKNELGNLFARIQYYFPRTTIPKVITLINEVDKDAKAIYADSLVLLSLDCYLGEKHRFYEDFPTYQRIEFNEDQMMPDLVKSFSLYKIRYPNDNTLLSQMIYYGKQLYLKDVLLQDFSDEAKIAYSENQLKWCKENETQMWSYFIENKLLFDANPKNKFRFINDAPFSKFYLEIDNESPGRVGQWLGWQIVRSFMKNNAVSLPEMLAIDAKTLFENSKYKPAK